LTSPKAKEYTDRLNYLRIDVCGAARNLLLELTAVTISALGSLRDKNSFAKTARQYLYKLKMLGVEI